MPGTTLDLARVQADPNLPGPIPIEALEFFRNKRLEPSFDHRDVWAEEHAAAFTAAKLMERDVLDDVRQEVDRAIREGITLREFQRTLRDRLSARGWWGEREVVDPKTGKTQRVRIGNARLKTIFDTNLRVARAAGQWERIQRAAETRPYLLYQLGPSERHRPQHVAWAGTLLPVDDPFWDVAFPPNGWGCKCTVRQVTVREAERRGGVSARPDLEYSPFENPRRGEVRMVPKGIDPGFAYNPGAQRMKGLQDESL